MVRAVWPDFRAEDIVYEDDDLLVVAKPAGVPSQSARPDRPDDLVTRLRLFIAMRDGGDVERIHLGVHQRLDKDTSGVVLFTKRPSANPSIAEQFEKHRATKRYLAAVTGFRTGTERARLTDRLAPDKDGRMQVGRGRTGQEAITEVRVLSRRGSRALLELRLVTGRTHQARVQLAHARAPIAGDRLYGGAPAP